MNVSRSPRGTVLVTDASSGIGLAYSDRFAGRGNDLVLVSRDAERLDTMAMVLENRHGVNVEIIDADLTSKADLARVEARLDKSDIGVLVNNAGVVSTAPLVVSDIDQTEALIELNVTAFTRLATIAAKVFVQRGAGAIINLGSVFALAPERAGPAYAGSRSYVLGFTQALAQELKDSNVKLQAVLPGVTRAELFQRPGGDILQIPAPVIMEAADMVDAALVGFDRGELITIPALQNVADWEAYTVARLGLGPSLSSSQVAARYKHGASAEADFTSR